MTSKEASTAGAKEQFFRYFQLEITALQKQIEKLEALPAVGGERIDAIDHCLAGIAHLHKEVQNASSYVPSYDQKIYAEGIKALHEKLDQTRALLKPKSKFAFKNPIKKNDSAISLSDAAELALQQNTKLFRDPKGLASSTESSLAGTPILATPPNESVSRPQQPPRRDSLHNFLTAAGEKSVFVPEDDNKDARIRRMSFASSKSVTLSNHNGVHIFLPSSASHATSSGSVTNIQDAIIDMSMPTTSGQPFAALVIKNIRRSLLICGSVNGAAHVTDVSHSVIVVAVRQFRMHNCSDCTVYLHTNGQPIIEDCEGIRFAPIPPVFKPQTEGLNTEHNQWDQVQDFKWLKSEPSPNWSILAEQERLSEDQWTRITSTSLELSLKESLQIVGLQGD